jgi:hypothetical protein
MLVYIFYIHVYTVLKKGKQDRKVHVAIEEITDVYNLIVTYLN